jgi:predicted permease
VLTPLLVVLPIFALILVGFAARKGGVLGPHATAELNRFVVYFALPALLFHVVILRFKSLHLTERLSLAPWPPAASRRTGRRS